MLSIILSSCVRISLPLIFAALGAMYCERVSIINIGIEGIMLLGACFGVLGSYISGSAFVGLLFAIGAGAIIGLIHGVLTAGFKTNHIVVGVAINLFGAGFTTLMLVLVWGNKGKSVEVAGLGLIKLYPFCLIPGVKDVIGTVSPLFVLMIIVIILSYFFIFKTPWGLRIRVIGDNPNVADTMGINVIKTQIGMVVLGSILASIGGACLTIGDLNYFTRDMVAGRGFIALAAMVFGRWNPILLLFTSLFFGFMQALQIQLQGFGIPVQFIQMIPYLLTIITLIFSSKGFQGPAFDGKHFYRGASH